MANRKKLVRFEEVYEIDGKVVGYADAKTFNAENPITGGEVEQMLKDEKGKPIKKGFVVFMYGKEKDFKESGNFKSEFQKKRSEAKRSLKALLEEYK